MDIDPKDIAEIISEYPDGEVGRFGTGGPAPEAASPGFVLHVYGDDTYADVTELAGSGFAIKGDFARLHLGNGDSLYFAKSVDALKNNIELDEKELEALFNASLIDSDDETGEFLV